MVIVGIVACCWLFSYTLLNKEQDYQHHKATKIPKTLPSLSQVSMPFSSFGEQQFIPLTKGKSSKVLSHLLHLHSKGHPPQPQSPVPVHRPVIAPCPSYQNRAPCFPDKTHRPDQHKKAFFWTRFTHKSSR